MAETAAGLLAGVFEHTAVPAWLSRTGFRLLDPVKSLRQQVDFMRRLHDREALLPRERQRRFLMGEGWVAWPGPALADFMRQFIAHNRMLQGGFVIDDRLVTLADIDRPLLTVVGEVDEIAPAAGVRAITRAAPRAEVYELALRAGHFGLVVGSAASQTTWPAVAGWAHWRSGKGELPDEIRRVDPNEPIPDTAGVATRLGFGVELAAGAGAGLARSLGGAVARTADSVRVVAEEVTGQLPRLARLGRLKPSTRVSIGLLLDEQAADGADDVFFLFEDRAYSHGQVKLRVDAVVRGLLSLGIRQGEHVGVLMGTRPSGLSVLAALSRLGAVAVLMRPDGPVVREAELGDVQRIVADPELAARAREAGVGEVLVLGGGGEERDLGVAGVIDMERIDPDEVEVPAWYRPNPGRASDLGFILFTGDGERTRANRITNGRWGLSAYATASAAALSSADTVYAVTPIYHPSGLLMSIGGAVAGGARLAIARRFDPETFWEEVRRYGVTVASYTWTMLREIAAAPPDPSELHHPVRLFIGAGMPRGLWRRIADRFSPATVLEFYASTEGEAILVNVRGDKPGCKGRPLPGSAECRLASYEVSEHRLRQGATGFAVPCRPGEVGMLLTRQRGVVSTSDSPLRGLFEPDDAWLSTGDLFRIDEDGDYWLIDHVQALIPTRHGFVGSSPIVDALGDVDAIDLAVVYGVPESGAEICLAIAAVTVRDGFELTPGAVAGALDVIDANERPDIVDVVKEIPVTTWYRPIATKLQAAGMPKPGPRTWRRDGGDYVPLEADSKPAAVA